jgi:hypothetical protein
LQRASSSVEEELLFSSLHQDARPEAVHDRRWTTGAQEGHLTCGPCAATAATTSHCHSLVKALPNHTGVRLVKSERQRGAHQLQRRVGRRSGTLCFDHPRSLFSVAARRSMVCPTASRPMRVTAP